MNGFQKRTKAKMDQIEQCAIQMLHKPVQDIAVAEIAKLARVSQVTIYNYYGSKEALLIAALKRMFGDNVEQFKQLVESGLSFDEKLKRMILMKREASQLVHPDTYVRLIADNPEMHAYVQAFNHEHSIPLFLKLVQEGRACGKVRSHIHDEALLMYMNLLTQAIAAFSEEVISQLDRPGGVEEIIDLFFYGILNQNEESR